MDKCKYCQSDLSVIDENDKFIWYKCNNENCKVIFKELKNDKKI